jgi:ERF superfamily
MRDPEPMPASIVKAICRVQASIQAVAKTQTNEQGGYPFASTDDIYASLSRKFAEAGLVIYPFEIDQPEIRRVEKTNRDGMVIVSQWALFRFGYMLSTEDASWYDPRSCRTIFLQILGPQTFGAAESYCQKQYLRALLKIPTGDHDLDSLPQSAPDIDEPAKRKSSAEGKRDGSVKRFNTIRAAIQKAEEPSELLGVRRDHLTVWLEMPRAWLETLNEEYITKMADWGIVIDAETMQEIEPEVSGEI